MTYEPEPLRKTTEAATKSAADLDPVLGSHFHEVDRGSDEFGVLVERLHVPTAQAETGANQVGRHVDGPRRSGYSPYTKCIDE